MTLYKPADEFTVRLNYRIHDGGEPGVKIFMGSVCVARIIRNAGANACTLHLGLEHSSIHPSMTGAIQLAVAKLKEKKHDY